MSDTHVPRAAKACPQKKIKKERQGFGRTGFLRLLHTPKKYLLKPREAAIRRGDKNTARYTSEMEF